MAPSKRRASQPSSSATTEKKKKMDIPVPSAPKSRDKKSDKMKCRVCHEHHPQRNQFAYQRIEFDRTELAWLDWINCVGCKNDFHIGCVGKQPFEKMLIASFVCQACEKSGRRTTNKTRAELGEISNGEQIGSQQWINTTLQKKKFEDAAIHRDQQRYGLIQIKDGEEFSAHFDPKKEWRAIYLIKRKEGLGIQVPTAPFGMDELIKLMKVDPTQWLENVIDVTAQITTRMSLDRFGELFNNTDARERIYNILSLEYSRTGLADIVIPPEIYRTLSLADRYWPLGGDSPERCDTKHEASRPAVERFVLIGMGGSFTDFHIDFGGSSVWYHVYQGQKVFYAAPPTPKNLQLFEDHKNSDHQATVFLGDKLEQCWKVVIDQGSTLLIPSGYVHAVFTPVDSIVFGGNFLTFQGLKMQIEIQKMDTRRELGDLFGYPSFDTVMFYTALTLSMQLDEYCEQKASGLNVQPDYIDGAAELVEYLKEEKEVASNKKKPAKFARGMTKKEIVERLEQAVARAKEEFIKSNYQSTKSKSEMMMIETSEKKEEIEEREDMQEEQDNTTSSYDNEDQPMKKSAPNKRKDGESIGVSDSNRHNR